jgi:cysteine-rich repeat protein
MRQLGLLILMGMVTALVLVLPTGCEERREGTVQVSYTLLDNGSGEPIDCETAAVDRIQLLVYESAAEAPSTYVTECNATSESSGEALFKVPAGAHIELGVRMLRSDGGPSCLATRLRASWTFSNGEQGARVPKGGTTILQDLEARFNPQGLPVCGNGEREPCEDCDDGNNEDGDGCSANCLIEQPGECGNGEREPGEDCDDGNDEDGDGCSANCRWERADLTVEWSLRSQGGEATCEEMNVETFTLTLTPTGEATPIETLEGLDCNDQTALLEELGFGVYDLEIVGRDGESQLTAFGEATGVTHTSFEGTRAVIEVTPFEGP